MAENVKKKSNLKKAGMIGGKHPMIHMYNVLNSFLFSWTPQFGQNLCGALNTYSQLKQIYNIFTKSPFVTYCMRKGTKVFLH